MTVSAFEHPFLSGLLGDAELQGLLGPEAEMAAMLRFEAALAQAQAELGIIPDPAGAAIRAATERFKPDLAALKAATGRDGVVVPELVRQLRDAAGKPHGVHVHFGATSQDVIDTTLMLRLQPVFETLDARLGSIVGELDRLERAFGGKGLMAHTRMQPALPITVADRIESWRAPLVRHRQRLSGLLPLLAVQFGGATGTLGTFGDHGPALRRALAQKLGLADAPQWQSQRDRIADVANLAALVTGSLGKMGQDVALMAQGGEGISLSGGGGSSAMAHKQNPVAAEILVTLARYNAVQVAGVHQSMVHEQERSGAAWTLEWLILPQMMLALGAATLRARDVIDSIRSLGN